MPLDDFPPRAETPDTTAIVVIPAYNAEETLRSLLSIIQAQKTRAVVVDDGSTDRTPEIIREFTDTVGITQPNGGPAKARNTGWRSTRAGFVIFTDADCEPQPGWAEQLVQGFSSDDIAAVTGSYEIANAQFWLPCLIHEEIKDRHHAYRPFVRVFGTYNVALRRTVLEQTGGFDETYRQASGEDNDLSYRVLKGGYRIAFEPRALVAHNHTRSLRKYLREQYRHGYWRTKLYKAHPDMAGGDDYTRLKDIVEPPLALVALASVLTLPAVSWLCPSAMLALFVIQMPAAVRIAVRRRSGFYLALALVTFARAFARGVGMGMGAIQFFVRNAG